MCSSRLGLESAPTILLGETFKQKVRRGRGGGGGGTSHQLTGGGGRPSPRCSIPELTLFSVLVQGMFFSAAACICCLVVEFEPHFFFQINEAAVHLQKSRRMGQPEGPEAAFLTVVTLCSRCLCSDVTMKQPSTE